MMKLAEVMHLKRLIREELASMTQASKKSNPGSKPHASTGQKLGHLSTVQGVDARAYKAWVGYLAEDCRDEFFLLEDGRLKVKTSDGKTLFWDPENTMGDWESSWPGPRQGGKT